jgi:hypothetical protein
MLKSIVSALFNGATITTYPRNADNRIIDTAQVGLVTAGRLSPGTHSSNSPSDMIYTEINTRQIGYLPDRYVHARPGASIVPADNNYPVTGTTPLFTSIQTGRT